MKKLRIADCGLRIEKHYQISNIIAPLRAKRATDKLKSHPPIDISHLCDKYQLVIVLFVFIAASCGLVFTHNPQKARGIANSFLNAVYVDGDFRKAYAMVDNDFEKNFGPGYLEKIGLRFNKVFHRLEGIKADYYLFERGDRSIMLLFTGLSEKAPSYHRIMMTGDARHGYKVSAVFYSDMPFTGYRTLKPFK